MFKGLLRCGERGSPFSIRKNYTNYYEVDRHLTYMKGDIKMNENRVVKSVEIESYIGEGDYDIEVRRNSPSDIVLTVEMDNDPILNLRTWVHKGKRVVEVYHAWGAITQKLFKAIFGRARSVTTYRTVYEIDELWEDQFLKILFAWYGCQY